MPFMPLPVVVKEGSVYRLVTDPAERPSTIGKLREFWGNMGMFVRAWALIRELGPEGLRRVAELAVLNANYVRAELSRDFNLPYETETLHEVVFDDKLQKDSGVSTMDVAKRLIDHGSHPPTVYFPLVVHGALMIEPTETESKETLDQFIAAMRSIAAEAKARPRGPEERAHEAHPRAARRDPGRTEARPPLDARDEGRIARTSGRPGWNCNPPDRKWIVAPDPGESRGRLAFPCGRLCRNSPQGDSG